MLSACGGCSESSCSYSGRSVRHAAFDVSSYHPMKRPAGATGLPSPGDTMRASSLGIQSEVGRYFKTLGEPHSALVRLGGDPLAM